MRSDWFEPDQPWRERLIARAAVFAVLAAMIVLWARLIVLWRGGTIREEAFFGSTAWNLAIFLPGVAWIAVAWAVRQRRTRERERGLELVMTGEPLSSWHRRIRELDAKLPDGASGAPALERAARELASEIVSVYAGLDAESRARVRQLWRTYEKFNWYAAIDAPITADGVRRKLILWSIRDMRPDPRDEAVALGELDRAADEAGIDLAPIAREVAELSDDSRDDRWFGTPRAELLQYAAKRRGSKR